MSLTSGVVIKHLLEKYDTKPFKGLGQNFLINSGILEKIVESANLEQNDIILEVGPGLGALTQELAKRAKKVFAIEKDQKMVEILKETLVDFKNVKVIEGDAIKLKTKNYKLIANLPYNITSPVIRKFLESKNPPKEMILMVQKEVAKRICAKPPDMNLLAISVQFYSEPKILFYVSKNNFWPRPKVDGTIIHISGIKSPPNEERKELFFRIVKAGFSHPRKNILNNLSKVLELDKEKTILWLGKCDIDFNRRAETLSIKEWLKLSKNLKNGVV